MSYRSAGLSVPTTMMKGMYPHRTVEFALPPSRPGVADWENAQICGVSPPDHPPLANRYPARPGQQGRALPRCDGKLLDEDAYAYLLGLYLGDGHIAHGRREVYALNVKCDNSWPGLIDSAHTAMAAVMPTSSVFRVARTGCTEVKCWSRHWPCLFPQHGPGRKHTRKIALEPWQQKSADIIGLCAHTLNQLEVRWRMARPNVLSVARRESVARMDELVGPKY